MGTVLEKLEQFWSDTHPDPTPLMANRDFLDSITKTSSNSPWLQSQCRICRAKHIIKLQITTT